MMLEFPHRSAILLIFLSKFKWVAKKVDIIILIS